MSELNKIAREYLESLGVEVPAVQDAAPKTFDTQDRRNKVVPAPPAAAAPRQVTVTRALRAPDELGEARRVQRATSIMIEQHIRDVKAERRAAEGYKDAREMWDAINFQPLPIAAEEVVAPRAWRTLPTGNEVRAAILIGVLILSVIAFFVMRTP